MKNYVFTSKRLGFRNWNATDVASLYEINSNKEVMRFFPSTQTRKQTTDFITRMQQQFEKFGFCYFAVEIIKSQQLIGFIGLSEQTYEVDFNPSVDIGWRLHPDFWGKGYATEGAKKCLEYAFNQLKLESIISTAPKVNIPSITVMEKLGMQKVKDFIHPKLLNQKYLKECVLFEIVKK